MDEEYDCIVLGTGLKECILSGLLSVDGKKVLHMDRNDYYGGASASLNLNQLYQQYKGGASANAALGASREYNVDIVPKFIMAGGILVKMLIHTDVTKYLEFKVVEGSYVQKNGKINKVPATEKEALQTNLMGLLEKRRFKKMLEFISQWEAGNPKTHKGISPASTMREVFQKFDLDAGTVDFTGHALALYLEDSYLDRACPETFDRIKLYFESLARYQKSPYIYPLYGLGELPQAFARLSAIYGGTYMLSKPIDEVLYDSSGKFTGVRSGEEVVKARFVVGDPSYFPGKVHTTGKVVRIVCIMDHGIPGIKDSESVQIIIPQNQVNRNHDIYITLVSFAHMVAPKGKYIAMVSTTVETANPEAECQPGIDLLGPILERFVMVTDSQEANGDGSADQVFISKSFDATSHFETTCLDVMEMYRRITGKDLDLSAKESHGEGEGSTSN